MPVLVYSCLVSYLCLLSMHISLEVEHIVLLYRVRGLSCGFQLNLSGQREERGLSSKERFSSADKAPGPAASSSRARGPWRRPWVRSARSPRSPSPPASAMQKYPVVRLFTM